ncbi:MAG: tetratricopeptide repeat protein [Desulfobacterales bacterium]
MPKSTSHPTNTVQQSTLIGVAVLCLAVGFLGGVVFSIYKSTGVAPVAVPTATQPDIGDRAQELDRLTKETAQNPGNGAAWTQLGNLYFDTNIPEKAIWAYQKSLEIDPANPNVWTDLGVMYRRSNQPQEAIKAFDEAIRLDSKHEPSRFNKGIVQLHDLNDPTAGIKTWEDLLVINPLAMAPNGKSVDELVVIYKKNIQKPK